MPERAAIARRLKDYRKQHQLPQFQFAEECGISVEVLSLLECEKGNPTLGTLQCIAAYTGMTVAELVDVRD